MKNKLFVCLLVALLIGCVSPGKKDTTSDLERLAEGAKGKWSDYGDYTAGQIIAADTFLVRDSDDATTATGIQKEYPWSVMKTDLATWMGTLTTLLATTGYSQGGIEPIIDDNSLVAAQCYGSIDKLTGAETTTLPACLPGMSTMLYSDDATVKTIDPNGTENIWLDGATDNGDGNSINSPGAVGDFIVLWCYSTGNWLALGRDGVWIDTP